MSSFESDSSLPGAPGSATSLGEGVDAAATLSADKTRQMVERMVQGAHDAVDKVAEKAIPAVEKLRSGVSSAAGSVQERADALTELQREWTESCRSAVRENPMTALAVGVVAGVVLSRLLSSRR